MTNDWFSQWTSLAIQRVWGRRRRVPKVLLLPMFCLIALLVAGCSESSRKDRTGETASLSRKAATPGKSSPNSVPATSALSVDTSGPQTVQTHSGDDASSPSGATVMGVVRSHETGRPIMGACVQIQPYGEAPQEIYTDREGRYVFHGIPEAKLESTYPGVKLSGYLVHGGPKSQSASEPGIRAYDFYLRQAYSIYGRVLLADNIPAVAAKLTHHVKDESDCQAGCRYTETLTDATGSFDLDLPPDSRGRLSVELEGWTTEVTEPLEGKPGRFERNFTLTKGAQISGKVIDPEGKPVSDASIVCGVDSAPNENMNLGYQNETHSEADGSFSIRGIPQGKARLHARKPGFSRSTSIELDVARLANIPDITLQLQEAFEITGIVVDQRGNPITSATISAGSVTTESAVDGRFRLADVPEDVYTLHGRKDGYQEAYVADIRAGKSSVTIQLTQHREDIVMTGQVVDIVTKEPVTDFEIETEHKELTLEKDPTKPGAFLWKGLNAGNWYKLQVKAPGYIPGRMETVHGESDYQQPFEIGRGGTLTGRVVETESRKPLEGMPIRLYWGHNPEPDNNSSATTNREGRFTITMVEPGWKRLKVECEAPKIQLHEVWPEIAHGQTWDAGDIEIGSGGVIHGRVVRKTGGKPITDTLVRIAQKETHTDEQGKFEISGLVAGTHNIELRAFKRAFPVYVEANSRVEQVLELGDSSLEGRILYKGEPTRARCMLLVDQALTSMVDTDNGEFLFSDLAPGSYKLYVWGANTDLWEDIEIAEGAIQRTFHLPSGKIHGIVVDSSGQPVLHAYVRVQAVAPTSLPGEAGKKQIESKAGGLFSQEGYRAGKYVLTASRDKVGVSESVTVEVTDGREKPVHLKLSDVGGTLETVALAMDTGLPLTQVVCVLEDEYGELRVGWDRDEFGRSVVQYIRPGQYTLYLTSNVQDGQAEYAGPRRSIEIKTGETTRIDEVLQPAGKVKVMAIDAGGIPLAVESIRCYSDQPNFNGFVYEAQPHHLQFLGPERKWESPLIPAGSVRIHVTYRGKSASTTAVIRKGRTTEVVIPITD